MSLRINNRATIKQESMLTSLGYLKRQNNWPLTREQAAQIIDELLEQERQEKKNTESYYGSYDDYKDGDREDPFDNINKWNS